MTADPQPLVSILIPTKDHYRILDACINAIRAKSSYRNYEILVIDNGTTDNESLAHLTSLKKNNIARIVPYPEPYNFSAMNNRARRSALGEYLVFLNDDTEVISPEWIESLLEYARQSDVGAVGCTLLYPDHTIQHAGVVVGRNEFGGAGIATHWPKHIPDSSAEYERYTHRVRSVGAVTAACMMMRAQMFDALGGFDENLPGDFNDVDICLRIRKQGLRVMYTPHAVLYHVESKNRSRWDGLSARTMLDSDIQYFLSKWKPEDLYDPYDHDACNPVHSWMPSAIKTFGAFVKRYGLFHAIRIAGAYAVKRFTRAGTRFFLFRKSRFFSRKYPAVLFVSFSLTDLCVQYRVRHIVEYLSMGGISSAVIGEWETKQYKKIVPHVRCIVLFRTQTNRSMESFLAVARRRGIPLVYSSDDLVFLPEYASYFPLPTTGSHRDYQYAAEAARKRFAVFRQCDYFLASTPSLAKAVDAYGKTPLLIHNGIGTEQMRRSRKAVEKRRIPRDSSAGTRVIIGYASGTMTHERDVAVAIPALVSLLAAYPFLELRIIGHLARDASLRPYESRVRYIPFVPWRRIQDVLCECDILIAPFCLDSPFTNAKSEVKFIEAALVRVPTVASPIASYRDAIHDGVNGFLASNDYEWTEKLRTLIESKEERTRIGAAAYDAVMKEYAPSALLGETYAAFTTIIPSLFKDAKEIHNN